MASELELILREEIAQAGGALAFDRFMELALYHPRLGYYRRAQDPFGKHGDFFTASQLQPIFGLLVARRIQDLLSAMQDRQPLLVELGPGRKEMQEAFSTAFRYVPVETGDSLPAHIRGAVFGNEFFDALPVRVARYRGGRFVEMRVSAGAAGFAWVEGEAVDEEMEHYLSAHGAPREEGFAVEVCLEAQRWLERISARLDHGLLVIIDYGYTTREWVRFPRGTLMSYRRHRAEEDVLSLPGERDITAHVNFSALIAAAPQYRFRLTAMEPLASTLVAAGERDHFAGVIEGISEQEALRRRLQLKTLLYGMGDTFRTLILQKNVDAETPDGNR
jgi:SAM-dependent MidA family methyltransferase